MALFKRQAPTTYGILDDQGSVVIGYMGNWTHVTGSEWLMNTCSCTTTPQSSYSLTFVGTGVIILGGVSNRDDDRDWPTARYVTDGIPGGYQMPYFDSNNRSVIYFETPAMPNGTHTVNVTVTWCNETNPYILDYVLVESPQGAIDSGVETTRMAPSSTPTIVPIVITQPIPVGAIVGGVVGGIAATAILVFVAYYFLIRGPRDRRSHYFKRPGAADILAGEDYVGSINTTPASSPLSSTGLNGRGRQSAFLDSSWSVEPWNPDNGHTAANPQHTRVPGGSGRPETGRGALITQQYENA